MRLPARVPTRQEPSRGPIHRRRPNTSTRRCKTPCEKSQLRSKAYLSYLEALQQQATNPASHPALTYWQQLIQARDAHSVAEAQKQYALASVEHQATTQRAAADASTSYLQQTKDIWERLQSEVARQNQEIANSLKDDQEDRSPAGTVLTVRMF